MEGGIDLQRGLPELPEGLVEPTPVAGLGIYLTAISLIVLTALLFGWLAWRWLRRRGARDGRRTELPPKREAEEALRQLQQEAARLPAAELALRLSATVRRCVDRLWHTSLTRQTWHEHWSEQGDGLKALPGHLAEAFGQLLADCNSLKFEPVEIAMEQKQELLRRASDLLSRLPPRPAAAPPETRALARG